MDIDSQSEVLNSGHMWILGTQPASSVTTLASQDLLGGSLESETGEKNQTEVLQSRTSTS